MFQRKTASDQHDSTERLGRDEGEKRTESLSLSSFSAGESASDEDTIERMVCWDLEQRGDVGETALHMSLLLSKTPKFREIAVALLDAFPLLSVDYYEDDEYYGTDQWRH